VSRSSALTHSNRAFWLCSFTVPRARRRNKGSPTKPYTPSEWQPVVHEREADWTAKDIPWRLIPIEYTVRYQPRNLGHYDGATPRSPSPEYTVPTQDSSTQTETLTAEAFTQTTCASPSVSSCHSDHSLPAVPRTPGHSSIHSPGPSYLGPIKATTDNLSRASQLFLRLSRASAARRA